jgi:hypothetical protein
VCVRPATLGARRSGFLVENFDLVERTRGGTHLAVVARMLPVRPLARVVVIGVIGVWGLGSATADDEPAPSQSATPAPPAHAVVLEGRVTDVTGKPVARARIHVMPRGGARVQAETDADGRYRMTLTTAGAHSVVVAIDKVHTLRQVDIAADAPATLDVQLDVVAGGEVINVIDKPLVPEVMPKARVENVTKSLPYSTEAVLRDAWARAFLLLDVDERGAVTRLKLLKRPGFGLDQTAVDEGFKLTFDPALDKQGKPMRTHVVWSMEWPSWSWLIQGKGTASGRPVDHDGMYRYARQNSGTRAGGASRMNPLANANWAQPLPTLPDIALDTMRCAGSGPLELDLKNRAYRDCSVPDLSAGAALPWITRENARTVLAELDAAAPKLVAKPRSRLPHLISGGVTLAAAVAAGVSYWQYDKYSDLVGFKSGHAQGDGYDEASGKMAKWRSAMFASAGAFVVSGALTAFLWSRGQTKEYFSVQPTSGGGAVSFGRSF